MSSAVAAFAVVLAGLVWSAAPAHAIETITVNPSSYTDPTQPLEVTINGFPTMALNSYYVYWLDFTNMTGSNSGTTCPTFTLVSGSGTPTPNGSPGANSSNPTLSACSWQTGTKFRFVYSDATGLNSSSRVKITFPANSFTLPGSGQYGINFTAGYPTQQWQLDSACLGNCPSGSSSLSYVTIRIDANGGSCQTQSVTGIMFTWATAPSAGNCARAGAELAGFNTAADGSGIAIAPDGNLHLTGDNTLYAQYVTPKVAGAPTDVVATGGYKNVKVSWKAPRDPGTSSIGAYLVQTDSGRTCVTRMQADSPMECTYTELAPGTNYTFKVQALNRAGWSDFSAASNAATPYDLKLDSISRPEVKFLFIKRGSKLEAEGRAPGLKTGTVLTPHMQVGTDGAFVALTKETTKVDGDSAFTWSTKLDKKDNGKPVSLYFTYANAKTSTLTAKLGATIGLPSAPREVTVKSGASGFTVSWKAPTRNGGSPISEYVMTSDLRAPSWAQSKFVTCTVKAPATTCTMPGSVTDFDPKKEYSFSVVAKTERGMSPQATQKWKGQLYRLYIFKRARVDSEVLLSFSAVGWPKDARGFEIQAKVGENGTWKKQGTAQLEPDYEQPIGDWQGMLPKSVKGGSEVFYRIKSDKGYSNVVRFRLQSSFEYSAG
jgi:hypothetical protein